MDAPVNDSPHVLELPAPVDSSSTTKKKRDKKPQPVLSREPGKSLFPVSRVQKIIKADKDIPIVAKEATFLISLATEEFIKRLCESASQVAQRSSRLTVQHKDVATIVRKADEFLFLEDIIPWSSTDASAPKKKHTKQEGKKGEGSGPTLLDHFGSSKKDEEKVDGDGEAHGEDEEQDEGGDSGDEVEDVEEEEPEEEDNEDGVGDEDEDGDVNMFADGTMGTG